MTAFEPCGLGPCAAESGHDGTCVEASGWDEPSFEDEVREAIANARRKKQRWRIWQDLADENRRLRDEAVKNRAVLTVIRYLGGKP